MSAALIKDINREYNDVESALLRIQNHKGVQGLVITTHEGSVIRSSLDNIQTPQIAMLVYHMLSILDLSLLFEEKGLFEIWVNYLLSVDPEVRNKAKLVRTILNSCESDQKRMRSWLRRVIFE